MVHVPAFEREKTEALIAYIGKRVHTGRTKLMKLLYLMDFESVSRSNKSITGCRYEHWDYGPVPVEAFHFVKNEASVFFDVVEERSADGDTTTMRIVTSHAPDLASHCSEEEIEVIDQILTKYGMYRKSQLVDLSHRQLPWKITNFSEEIPYFLARYLQPYKTEDADLEELRRNKEFQNQLDIAFEEFD